MGRSRGKIAVMTIYPDNLKPILDKIDPTFGRMLECDSGWWDLIEDLHNEINEIDPDYRIYQVKEKFGALRFYYAPSNPDFKDRIDSIVARYERISLLTCEVTGKPGQLMFRDGVWKTLHRSFFDEGWESAEGAI